MDPSSRGQSAPPWAPSSAGVSCTSQPTAGPCSGATIALNVVLWRRHSRPRKRFARQSNARLSLRPWRASGSRASGPRGRESWRHKTVRVGGLTAFYPTEDSDQRLSASLLGLVLAVFDSTAGPMPSLSPAKGPVPSFSYEVGLSNFSFSRVQGTVPNLTLRQRGRRCHSSSCHRSQRQLWTG